MDASELLRQVEIPTPCRMDWNLMSGGDRVRFCDSCSKHVYNLSAITSTEIVELLRLNEGDTFCGRLYKRPDGSVVTSECPPFASPPRRLQFRLRSVIALIATVGAALGIWRSLPNVEPPKPPVPPTPSGAIMGALPATMPPAVRAFINETIADP